MRASVRDKPRKGLLPSTRSRRPPSTTSVYMLAARCSQLACTNADVKRRYTCQLCCWTSRGTKANAPLRSKWATPAEDDDDDHGDQAAAHDAGAARHSTVEST